MDAYLLNTSLHLYKRLYPLVRQSVGLSVANAFDKKKPEENFECTNLRGLLEFHKKKKHYKKTAHLTCYNCKKSNILFVKMILYVKDV